MIKRHEHGLPKRRLPEPQLGGQAAGAAVGTNLDQPSNPNAPALEHRIQKQFLAMQVNKVNARKEFFRVNLADIHSELDKLKLGEDFTVRLWTDKSVATEYRESLDIENDPQKKEKWVTRQRAVVDRQLKMDLLRVPLPSDVQREGDGEDT